MDHLCDLNIKGMVKNTHLAKSITDSSWGMFFNLLAYKAEEAGRTSDGVLKIYTKRVPVHEESLNF